MTRRNPTLRGHKLPRAVVVLMAALMVACSSGPRPALPAPAPPTVAQPIPLTEAAIRSALARGGTIILPAGTVDITRPLRITRSGTKLLGAGRDTTVLRMAFGRDAFGPLLALPAELSSDFNGNPPPESMRVSDVEIAHLTIDGGREGNPNTYGGDRPSTLRFGIESTVSTDTWIHDVRLRDIAGDAISFGNGTGVNQEPRVEDVLVERAGRNGIHLGDTEDAAIRRTQILDTPGPYWPNAGAGNGIDIEVEGLNPHVFRTVIEDNEISRPSNPGMAGFGIQITRSFGDVDDVLVQRNTFRNHQLGVLAASATNVRIVGNEFDSSPIGQNNVTGGGIGLIAAPGHPASAMVTNNTFRFEAWRFYADSIVSVDGPGDWTVTDNLMLGGRQIFRSYDAPSQIHSARNQWKTLDGGPFFTATDPSHQTIVDTGSTRMP